MNRLVAACLAGDTGAGERLFGVVGHHARVTVRHFFGRDGDDVQDIAQDTTVAVLEFLRRRGEFTGSLVRFTVTVARNRCRNAVAWQRRRPGVGLDDLAAYLADPALGPLDTLLGDERENLARRALAALDEPCRQLLAALFGDGRSAEEMRAAAGLKTVAGLYHRRAVCLAKAGALLNTMLFDCSSTGPSRTGSGDDGGNWRHHD